MTAPVASGWSDRRVGLAPTGKAPPYHGARQKQDFTDRGVIAMLWPISLPIALVMYGALGIVNRVMPDSP